MGLLYCDEKVDGVCLGSGWADARADLIRHCLYIAHNKMLPVPEEELTNMIRYTMAAGLLYIFTVR